MDKNINSEEKLNQLYIFSIAFIPLIFFILFQFQPDTPILNFFLTFFLNKFLIFTLKLTFKNNYYYNEKNI